LILKTQKAGVIKDLEINRYASKIKKIGENVIVLGPFKIEGKKYVIATYFPSFKYWTTVIRNFPIVFNFLRPNSYLKQKNIDELIKGIRIYDLNRKLVNFNTSLYTEAYVLTRIWMRVYFNPFYPPHFQAFEIRYETVKKLADKLRHQRYPDANTDIEKLYVTKLQQANRQVYDHVDILEKHVIFVKNLTEIFKRISDSPSNDNIKNLQSTAVRFESVLEDMSKWCEDRAKSWSDFIDAYSAYKITHENNNPIKKNGLRAFFDGILGVLISILTGNSLLIGFFFSVGVDFGLSYISDLILKPKWQSQELTKMAQLHRADIMRVKQFLELYTLTPSGDNFRVTIK